jgi:hypothetical protein
MTKEEAIKLYDSGFWKQMSHEEIAKFQLIEERLCMPFEVFHAAIEKALDRPILTHEFDLNWEGLIKELFNGAPRPTLEEIINLIPEEKRIILSIKEKKKIVGFGPGDMVIFLEVKVWDMFVRKWRKP